MGCELVNWWTGRTGQTGHIDQNQFGLVNWPGQTGHCALKGLSDTVRVYRRKESLVGFGGLFSVISCRSRRTLMAEQSSYHDSEHVSTRYRAISWCGRDSQEDGPAAKRKPGGTARNAPRYGHTARSCPRSRFVDFGFNNVLTPEKKVRCAHCKPESAPSYAYGPSNNNSTRALWEHLIKQHAGKCKELMSE